MTAFRRSAQIIILVLTGTLLLLNTLPRQNNGLGMDIVEEETQGIAKKTDDPKTTKASIDLFSETSPSSITSLHRVSYPIGISCFSHVPGYKQHLVKPPENLS